MAKRANPFIEDFVQQSKTHVGIKQFNNNKERLQDVYDKTMQLLFKGAKKLASKAAAPTVPPTAPHKESRKMKQLAIGKDGALIYDTVVESLVGGGGGGEVCACASAASGTCAYCSRAQCATCVGLCVRCDRTYCGRCTLQGPDGETICMSCYQ